jgi:hypothetical protein
MSSLKPAVAQLPREDCGLWLAKEVRDAQSLMSGLTPIYAPAGTLRWATPQQRPVQLGHRVSKNADRGPPFSGSSAAQWPRNTQQPSGLQALRAAINRSSREPSRRIPTSAMEVVARWSANWRNAKAGLRPSECNPARQAGRTQAQGPTSWKTPIAKSLPPKFPSQSFRIWRPALSFCHHSISRAANPPSIRL